MIVIEDWGINCKAGGDPFAALEGTGKERRPLKCSWVPEMSVD